MKPWTRWQDWVALVVGVYALLSPIWTETNTGAMWALIILGAVLALVSLWSLAQPGMVAAEWAHALVGLVLFLSPWLFGYADMTGAAWTSWIAGAIALITGLLAVPQSNSAHRAAMQH
ncbi:hypothetical protein C3Y87_05085 [Carbonactinospora thermoautotrophica]|uniref:SPW repeat-containing integral membrane domain-containing protein n=1 Tax=Carbonactinospora thermoautotrophica TaxID=1469144 RepID=A0A132NII3_9ACTN|nr:SPW repeat protein [Carbonactinospora thermoautotrophica]KWX00302.1 hypothetical protein TH66_15820 [Carbonactinospora thermoautotrophica]KWX09512.1 hypothetical protein TR74_09125 [Carbonactinospora thermoautotrophica]MCX9190795.1 hypothetical protein [Carbonactinospora thermoautotrophica]